VRPAGCVVREQDIADRLQVGRRHEGRSLDARPRPGPRRRALELGGVVVAVASRLARLPRRRLELVLDAPHHDVGAGLPVLEDRVLEAALALVDRAEVEADLRVLLRELERFQEGQLRVLEAVELQVDQAEVVEERVGLGALGRELAVDLLRLLVVLLLEVEQPEQVEDLVIARAQQVGLDQLALGFVQPPGVVGLLARLEVLEKQALVRRLPGRLRHQ
jgi:hypothetical protein